MRYLFVVLVMFVAVPLRAQELQTGTLTGRVGNSVGEPVPYATVALVDKDKKILSHAVCLGDGTFGMPVAPVGSYVLQISSVGYEQQGFDIVIREGTGDLGTFTLKEGVDIDEIVVRGRPMISTEADRIIYDVTQDSTASTSAAMQILEKLPFVKLDKKTNRIEVMGESNFVITVNGKKSLFLSEANQYVATLLQADKMKQIELITAPEGKYQEKTAVINIVTDGNLPNGFVGDVSFIGTTRLARTSLGLTSKINRFIYNVYYQHEYLYNKQSNNSTVLNYLDDDIYKTESERTERSKGHKHTFKLDASYDLTEHDLLTITGSYGAQHNRISAYGSSSIRDISGLLNQSYDTRNSDKINSDAYTAVLNYQKSFRDKPGRLLTATYGFEHDTDNNDYDQDVTGEVNYRDYTQLSTNRLRLDEHTVGVDFSDMIGTKHSYFVTARLVARRYGSDMFYTPPVAGGDDANLYYRQYVPGVRASYSFRHKNLMLTGEVNLENTMNRMKFGEGSSEIGRDFFDVRPRATMVYRLAPSSSLMINYTVPSFRPDIHYLNPYLDDSDPAHLKVGNPDLKPENSHIASLAYNFFTPRINLRTSVVYKYSGNAIYAYDYTSDEGVLTTTYGNIGKSEALTFNLSLEYEIPHVLELWAEAIIAHTNYSYDENEFPLWNYDLSAGIAVYLSPKVYIQATGWMLPFSTSVQSTKFHYSLGYSLRAGYIFNDRFMVQVNAERFGQKYRHGRDEKKTDTFYYYRKDRYYSRLIAFSFTYTFGRLDGSVKKSQRAVQNEDRRKE